MVREEWWPLRATVQGIRSCFLRIGVSLDLKKKMKTKRRKCLPHNWHFDPNTIKCHVAVKNNCKFRLCGWKSCSCGVRPVSIHHCASTYSSTALSWLDRSPATGVSILFTWTAISCLTDQTQARTPDVQHVLRYSCVFFVKRAAQANTREKWSRWKIYH